MFVSNQRITESILETLERLRKRSDMAPDAAYDLMVAAMMLRHTRHVHTSNGEDIRSFGAQTAKLMQVMQGSEIAAAGGDSLKAQFNPIIAAANGLATTTQSGVALKQALMELLERLEAGFAAISKHAPDTAAKLFAHYTPQLLEQHNSIVLLSEDQESGEAEMSPGEPLTEANLSAYFQEKLADPTAKASKVVTLTGGFCKQTSLFTVTSQHLTADLVMRRDNPIDPFSGLDCHIASKEFPLLKAVFDRGFPVPEPLFMDEHPEKVAGPAFTIMRRSPGTVTGTAAGAESRVAPEVQRALAKITAKLHSLPPLTELSDNPAFDASLWTKTASECTRIYISSWYQHYQNTIRHVSMPVLHGLYNWLLSNIPVSDEPSALIHGDIGSHNLLFHEGQLSAVLDWEFAHVGDPAEDLGYIRSMMGTQMDWAQFITDYAAETQRPAPDEKRIRFFEIWSHTRNSTTSPLIVDHFEAGRFRTIKYGAIMYQFQPHFLEQAQALIDGFNNGR